MIKNINKSSKEVIMIKVANLCGNKEEYIIYLIGKKEHSGVNTFYSQLEIVISNGVSGKLTYIDLKDVKGYNPKVLLREFKDEKKQDIVFTLEEALEEDGVRVAIYSLENEEVIKIFDSYIYLLDKKYKVIYNDNFKANLIDTIDNLDFTIYIKDKHLNNKFNGQVLKISEVLAVKGNNNEVFDLLLKQKIIGEDVNDIVGEIVSVLRFDGNNFNEIDKKVSIIGSKISRSKENSDKKYDFSKVEFIESDYKPNLKIERAIETEFSLNPDVDKLNYLYNRIKLNDSTGYQIVAYLEGPKFCSIRGGTVIILEQKNNEYVVTSKIYDITPPVIVSDNITEGYKDLIVRAIKNNKSNFRILKYNGNSYPINPLNEQNLREDEKIIGVAVISDDLYYRKGIEYGE